MPMDTIKKIGYDPIRYIAVPFLCFVYGAFTVIQNYLLQPLSVRFTCFLCQ